MRVQSRGQAGTAASDRADGKPGATYDLAWEHQGDGVSSDSTGDMMQVKVQE